MSARKMVAGDYLRPGVTYGLSLATSSQINTNRTAELLANAGVPNIANNGPDNWQHEWYHFPATRQNFVWTKMLIQVEQEQVLQGTVATLWVMLSTIPVTPMGVEIFEFSEQSVPPTQWGQTMAAMSQAASSAAESVANAASGVGTGLAVAAAGVALTPVLLAGAAVAFVVWLISSGHGESVARGVAKGLK